MHKCGAWVRHALYVEVVDDVSTTELLRFRCVNGVEKRQVTLKERVWRFTQADGFLRTTLSFDVNVEIESRCGWDAWYG